MLLIIYKKNIKDDIFKGDEPFNIMTLMSNKGLFMRFWDQPGLTELYHITPLPGKKEGINSGLASSMNLGISKHISSEKKGSRS